MAVTKKPLIRYKILDACLRNPYKNYTIDLLLDAVNEKLLELFDDADQCIKLRQLQHDIAFMQTSEGWSIDFADLTDGKKKIYRYKDINFSINNSPLNNVELNELQSAIHVLSQFEGMPQFEGLQEITAKLKYDLNGPEAKKPSIGFDTNKDLKGLEHFSALYNAVQNKTVLQIVYKDFINNEAYSYLFHPYYLKQYNNRWFLFGLHDESQKADWSVAIDRIITVENHSTIFIENTEIIWEDYFSDMIGVSKPANGTLEKVILHFNKLTGKYIQNKPIHETQRSNWISDATFEVKIDVYVNYELERLILSYGESVKVISPEHLKNTIKKRLILGLAQY